MKNAFKKLLLPILAASFLVTGCNSTPTESSVSKENIVSLSTTEIGKGSIGGYLIEISNDAVLEANETYACSYATGLANGAMTIKSSREESLTFEITGDGTFNLLAHKAGDSILTIYDSDGIISFNKVVHVRNPYEKEEILKAVADRDIYVSSGIYGDYRFVITDVYKSFATATLSGKEITEEKAGKAVFDLEYKGVANDSPFYGHFYYYTVTIDKTLTDLSDTIKEVYISKCADRVLVYYGESNSTSYYLLEMFTPQNN